MIPQALNHRNLEVCHSKHGTRYWQIFGEINIHSGCSSLTALIECLACPGCELQAFYLGCLAVADGLCRARLFWSRSAQIPTLDFVICDCLCGFPTLLRPLHQHLWLPEPLPSEADDGQIYKPCPQPGRKCSCTARRKRPCGLYSRVSTKSVSAESLKYSRILY